MYWTLDTGSKLLQVSEYGSKFVVEKEDKVLGTYEQYSKK
jgi:hypothetical protein